MKCKIYMKSGNNISICGVKDITIQNNGNQIVGIQFEYTWFRKNFYWLYSRIFVSALNLEQIEAISVK